MDVGKQTVQTERLEEHHHVKHEQPQREAEAQPSHCDERHKRRKVATVMTALEAVSCVEPGEHIEPHGDVLQRDEGDDERSPAWMARFEEVQGEEDVE